MANGNDDLLDFLDSLDEPSDVVPTSASQSSTPPVDQAQNTSPTADPITTPEQTTVSEIPKTTPAVHLSGTANTEVFNNYFNKVITFAGWDSTRADKFKNDLAAYLKISSQSSMDSGIRKQKRTIEKEHWELYISVINKILSKKMQIGEFKYFLNFGILDETLLNQENLSKISQINTPAAKEYEFFFLSDWLKEIYEDREDPSITELGVDFQKHLRENEKRMSHKEKEVLNSRSEQEVKEDRVTYEIKNMINSTVRITNTASANYFPILNDNLLPGKVETIFLNSKNVEQIIDELRNYDFSLFYRETLFKVNAMRNEIVMKEVKPYFIIAPVSGDRTVFWQELSSSSKMSKGRFVIPVFFNGDLRKSIIEACANFKWELNRSLKGAMWADPVEGGITGAFYDYINFYKKNQALSLEAKEKLKKLITDNRKEPRRIFAHYYYQWIEFERKGILKFDRVAREIFFRHCPFTKNIRNSLSKIPIYNDLNRKYNIITERTITRLENKFKKLRNEEGKLPAPAQEHLDYYHK